MRPAHQSDRRRRRVNTAKEAKEQRRGEGGRGEEVKERTLMIRGICIRGQWGEKKGECEKRVNDWLKDV